MNKIQIDMCRAYIVNTEMKTRYKVENLYPLFMEEDTITMLLFLIR